ncbi:unnamed protein product, partial [Vitis vinifera]|uniref:Uncharacterized protein n=1 Tax=Vitis vinifera TaxID=29760 RepID=D7TU28_VITVI
MFRRYSVPRMCFLITSANESIANGRPSQRSISSSSKLNLYFRSKFLMGACFDCQCVCIDVDGSCK